MASQREDQRPCVLIPAYQEGATIKAVVSRIREYVPDVIVVDDGSTDNTGEAARKAGAEVLRHNGNLGKGAALNSGFRYVREHGFDYVICMDGDGQHDPADIPRFIDAYIRTGIPVLIGNRMADLTAMPRVRRITNRLMSRWLSLCMGQYVPDTQCGLRLYRCEMLPFVKAMDSHFAAESEVLLHIADRGIQMGAIPIAAVYGDEKSKINPIRDTWRFIMMLVRYQLGRHERPSGW